MLDQHIRLGGPVAAVLIAVGLLLPVSARAQDDGPIFVPPNTARIGFNGLYRDGTWTPVIVQVNNRSELIIDAECEIMLRDIDGDEVQARRSFAIQPGSRGPTFVRLYVMPPVNSPSNPLWHIRVINHETRELLATAPLRPAAMAQRLQQQQSALAVIGRGAPPMGLNRFMSDATQHEQLAVVKDLDPSELPDRWYAWSLFEAVIWSPKAGDPASGGLQAQMSALREWVRRGGHLVVILPSVGSYWSSPDVADLIPPVRIEATRDIAPPPALLPSSLPPKVQAAVDGIRTPAHTFSPLAGDSELSVLARTADGEPIAVAHMYGFGRVTLIGVDLSDPLLVAPGLSINSDPNLREQLNALSMPAPESDLWGNVFGWMSPGLADKRLVELDDGKYTPANWNRNPQNPRKNPELSDPRTRERYDLSAIVTEPLAMRETAVGALLVAFFLFAVYWVVAGPVSFAVLKSMRKSQHSWGIFGLIVLLFSAVAWGGAYLIRPTGERIQHFTVLDADAQSGEVHTHSWMTLFVPTHGQVNVAVGGEQDNGARNTIASAGILYTPEQGAFLDPQRYTIDAARPDSVTLPMRATAKQLEVDYRGQPAGVAEAHPRAWGFFTGDVTYQNNSLKGTLTNKLPAPIEDVLFVYCPGNGETPYTWELTGVWQPGQAVSATPPRNLLPQNTPLVLQPRDYYNERSLQNEGFLGEVISKKGAIGSVNTPMGAPPAPTMISRTDVVRHTWLLSFYGLLPPPDFIERDRMFGPYAARAGEAHLTRRAGRPFDMTELTALRRLIIIGHVKTNREDDVPLPTPIRIDGRTVPSSGHTVVRWITTVKDAPTPPAAEEEAQTEQ